MWNDRQTGERLKFCTMIITEPNAFVAEIHDRMPALQGMKQLLDAANPLRLFQFQLTCLLAKSKTLYLLAKTNLVSPNLQSLRVSKWLLPNGSLDIGR
jgi:hypothetical protein